MKQIFLLLYISFFLTSCNQNTLAVWAAMKNATVGRVDNFRNIGSETEYDRLSLETKARPLPGADVENLDLKSEGRLELVSCYLPKEPPSEAHNLLESIVQITATIPPQACQCIPWGDCTKDKCACETLCPKDFNIFKKPNQTLRDLSAPENSLSFRNTKGGSQYESTGGYCWGHASITSKFNRLANFKENEKPKYDLKSTDLEIQNKAIEEYKGYIDQIVNNQVSDIPGFKNLEELSSHPALQSYIADKVAISWSERAMTFQGLNVALKSSPMKREQNEEFVREVVSRLNSHQQPQIVFTKKDERFTTHTLLVGDYFLDNNGRTILCTRDSNLPPVSNHFCNNIIYVNDQGELIYNQWGQLGGAAIAHNDSTDALLQRSALQEKCHSEKNCPSL